MKRLAHKTPLLITITLLFLLIVQVTVFADGGENGFTQNVHEYQVSLIFEKPVVVGENPIHVHIHSAEGMPVSHAEVHVSLVEIEANHTDAETKISQHGEMPGMSGMSEQPHSAPSSAHNEMEMVRLEDRHESGEYAGEITIDQAGECAVRVHLTIQGELIEVDFPLSVPSSQSGVGILAGFFAVNTAIIAAALIIKHRPVPEKINYEVQS
jgi:hypothetical protein